MTLKIPPILCDKRIATQEAMSLLDFTEKYLEKFNDRMAEIAYNKITASRFIGRGPFEILKKRRNAFSDDEVEDPEFFYIQKYQNVISRLVGITEHSYPQSKTALEDFHKLEDLLNFFNNQGYLTKRQINLVNYLLRKYPIDEVPLNLSGKIKGILHHHIKKEFMKAESTTELAEILISEEIKSKKVPPKKKMFFSLSQIRNELSS